MRQPTARAEGPDLTELAARKFVESHGGDALSILGERAAMAEERGHAVAARTWRDLAEVAAHLLGSSYVVKAAARRTAWRTSMRGILHRP